MPYFALIQRGDLLIPIVKGGDGPDSECLATWDTYQKAVKGSDDVPLAQAFPVAIFNTENEE